MKSCVEKLRLHAIRREEQLKRLARSSNASRKRVEGDSALRTERFRSKRKVKAHTASRRHCADDAKRGPECLQREVRNHSQPSEKCRRAHIESRLRQSLRQGFALKIKRHKCQIARHGNRCLRQHRL